MRRKSKTPPEPTRFSRAARDELTASWAPRLVYAPYASVKPGPVFNRASRRRRSVTVNGISVMRKVPVSLWSYSGGMLPARLAAGALAPDGTTATQSPRAARRFARRKVSK